MNINNPFDYEAANNLKPEEILNVYIADHNYSRFIESKRNIFLVGERGCGKTMTLIYNSFRVQSLKDTNEGLEPNFAYVGVYVTCNNPMMQKPEYKLLDEFRASVLSEHYLVLAIIHALAEEFEGKTDIFPIEITNELREEIKYTLGWELNNNVDFFKALSQFIRRESVKTQEYINTPNSDVFYASSLTFSSAITPLIRALKNIPILSETHFRLMIDDAHDLNPLQQKTLNSWIAFRDHRDFSFKVATTKFGQTSFLTTNGGTILEGHDFTRVDMERPLQNDNSEFGKLARLIIARRLLKAGIQTNVEEFFPENEDFIKDLQKCKKDVETRRRSELPDANDKQINDYVYKMARAEYFRRRKDTSNRPPYSGIEVLTHLSTGVVRNLLEPCYWMYEDVQSSIASGDKADTITSIPPTVQRKIILERSDKKWHELKNDLHKIVECTKEQETAVYNLFDKLAFYFRERLLNHESEPRAVEFIISAHEPEIDKYLDPLLEIALKAQYFYTKTGNAKDDGGRETYYVMNRMFLPARALDPIAQHARFSIRAAYLLNASKGQKIPSNWDNDTVQEVLDYE